MQIFISQLQQTVPQMNIGRGTREGLQSNFYKACLSAGTRETKENIEKYDILSGLHGCRDPGQAEASFREREPARFGFFRPPPSQTANTLCASYFLLFGHHNKRVQQ